MKVEHNISEEMRLTGCPTGQNCNECNLYRPIYRDDEKGQVTQIFDCQWNNIALLMSETKNRVFGVQQSVESARNESVKRQDRMLSAIGYVEDAILPSQ